MFAARFSELFEVEHFADGGAPEGEEDVVEACRSSQPDVGFVVKDIFE
jgi:hypothetical protein